SASRARLPLTITLPPAPTPTLFPYTTLFRSGRETGHGERETSAPGRSPSPGSRFPFPAGLLRGSSGLPADRRPDRCQRGYATLPDRKSTRLNSSHQIISYAVFCLKIKKQSRL